MSEIELTLNINNPADYYAALGVMTILSLQTRDADIRSHFKIAEHIGQDNSTFVISSDTDFDLDRVFDDLMNTKVEEDKVANVWRNKNIKNPAFVAPATLTAPTWDITLDWWLDDLRHDTSELKCWSGTARPVDMLKSFIKNAGNGGKVNVVGSVFGFDIRSSRDALQLGYSMKDTGEKTSVYPRTELLAAIGLQRFRPRRSAYFAWQKPVTLSVAHGAAVQEIGGLQQIKYDFEIRKVGQGVKQVVPIYANLAESATV